MHRCATACVLTALCVFASVVHAQEAEPPGAIPPEQGDFNAVTWTTGSAGGPLAGFFMSLFISASLFQIVAGWILYAKADHPGWVIFVPIYNTFVLLQMAGKPWWWLLLYLVPVVSFVVIIFHMIALAEAFGRSALFGVGIAFLGFIFVPILAFGDAEYCGPEWSGI